MKVVATTLLAFSLSSTAMAKPPMQQLKLDDASNGFLAAPTIATKSDGLKIARVYLYKNSRVKKELKFYTKAKKSRMA